MVATCTARLTHEASSRKCIASSFGCRAGRHYDEIWVTNGCRGRFQCSSPRTEASVGCQSLARRNASCRCDYGLSSGSATPSTEVHVTVAFGDGIQSCAAAVNGAVLSRLDPHRARVAYSWNVSAETLEILAHSWHVVQVPPPAGGPAAIKLPVLGTTLPGHSPPRLASRALFLDVDHMPIDAASAGSAMQQLWDFAPGAKMVASPEGAGCFNSGFMLFRPSLRRQREYGQLVVSRTAAAQVPPCDKGVLPRDQSYLNALYWNRTGYLNQLRASTTDARERRLDGERYVSLPNSFPVWRIRTVFTAPGCVRSPAMLRTHSESFHFFDRFAPWGADRATATDNSSKAALDAARCSGLAAAHEVWHEELLRLPARLRRRCLSRLRTAQQANRPA